MSQTKAQILQGKGTSNTVEGLIASGVITATTFKGGFNDIVVSGACTITGNLTVEGTETIINTETLDVSDKTVGIASTATASNTTADGAGIVIYGGADGNKSILFNNSKNVLESNISFGVGAGVTVYSDVGVVDGKFNAVGMSTFKGVDFTGGGALREKVKITAGKLSDNPNINLDDGMVHYFTTAETTTSVPNIMSSVGINTMMDIGDTLSVTVITTAAAAGYSPGILVDDTHVTENWVGGFSPSTGGTSGVDVYGFTLIKTANNQYTVLANRTKTSV